MARWTATSFTPGACRWRIAAQALLGVDSDDARKEERGCGEGDNQKDRDRGQCTSRQHTPAGHHTPLSPGQQGPHIGSQLRTTRAATDLFRGPGSPTAAVDNIYMGGGYVQHHKYINTLDARRRQGPARRAMARPHRRRASRPRTGVSWKDTFYSVQQALWRPCARGGSSIISAL